MSHCHKLYTACVQEPAADAPAPKKKRMKVSRSPAERPARLRHELLMEHNPPRERNDCYMIEPNGDVFEEELPTQKLRVRKPIKVCFKIY